MWGPLLTQLFGTIFFFCFIVPPLIDSLLPLKLQSSVAFFVIFIILALLDILIAWLHPSCGLDVYHFLP